jgi:hypothetical protein
MPTEPLSSELAAATSLLDLARRLGIPCLEHGGRLAELLDDPDVAEHSEWLEGTVLAQPHDVWTPGDAGFSHVLEITQLADAIDRVAIHSPLEHLAVLRGLCGGPLIKYFDSTEDVIVLDRGMPVPFAVRPVNDIYPDTTPYQPTLAGAELVQRGVQLYEQSAGAEVRVALDYRFRARIDELTWSDAGRLPRIATIHPYLGSGGLRIGERGDGRFFDVGPADWDLDATLRLLREVSDADAVVLPELSLPAADALEDALAGTPREFPALVVAGSAHVRDGTARANEARIYLDGTRVATHRKVHPYTARELPGGSSGPLVEDITREQKTITVLSGRHTRLAVVICADLNERRIPQMLEAAGVNLLLVPALTVRVGAFNGAICGLASHCQAVAVIANAKLDELPDVDEAEQPFLVMAAIPMPHADQQSHEYRTSDEPPLVAVLDPNLPLKHDDAVVWRAAS